MGQADSEQGVVINQQQIHRRRPRSNMGRSLPAVESHCSDERADQAGHETAMCRAPGTPALQGKSAGAPGAACRRQNAGMKCGLSHTEQFLAYLGRGDTAPRGPDGLMMRPPNCLQHSGLSLFPVGATSRDRPDRRVAQALSTALTSAGPAIRGRSWRRQRRLASRRPASRRQWARCARLRRGAHPTNLTGPARARIGRTPCARS